MTEATRRRNEKLDAAADCVVRLSKAGTIERFFTLAAVSEESKLHPVKIVNRIIKRSKGRSK